MRARWRASSVLVAQLLACCSSAEPSTQAGDEATAGGDAGVPSAGRDAASAPDAELPAQDGGSRADADTANDASESDAAEGDDFGPRPPQNPFTAPDGLATQHGDSAASDTSPLSGPGTGTVRGSRVDLLAACPSLFVTSQGRVLAVCTQIINQSPAVFLLDAEQGTTLASLQIAGGDLFGGVYPYLDAEDRLLVVDGMNQLLRVAARDTTLSVEGSVSLAAQL